MAETAIRCWRGFAARLGEHLGRKRASDGAVTLLIAINLRESLEDDRALAMAFANATVDPTNVTKDLTEARGAVREARQKAKDEPDPTWELLALMPWLPTSAVKGIASLLFAYSEDMPVSCSNLGDLPPDLARVDGTPAEYVFVRALDTDVTIGDMERSRGQLVVVSGRINGKISISVEGYQINAENSKEKTAQGGHRHLGGVRSHRRGRLTVLEVADADPDQHGSGEGQQGGVLVLGS